MWSAMAGGEKKPNIVFIVIDTLRWDHMGCYGYKRATTPTLDRIAAEGARFEYAIASSSWTMPCVMSMFTSVPPSRHGVTSSSRSLDDIFTTLAVELKKGGYQTAGITSNPLTHGKFGYSRGFDIYDDSTIIFNVSLDFFEDKGNPLRGIHNAPSSDEVTRQARSWLNEKRRSDRPFFLHLLYFDPHYDYMPPSPYDEMFTQATYQGDQTGAGITSLEGKKLSKEDQEHIIGLYDGEIRYADDYIGKLMEDLKKTGLYDDTVIVITGDHGDEFWDHGGVAHGHTLYDELIRIPLIVRYPKLIKGGAVLRKQAAHIDLMPTLLDIAGLPIPAQCQGRSLRSLLEGRPGGFSEQPAFSEVEIHSEMKSIRSPTQKIVERNNGLVKDMYSLFDDPKEQQDLSRTKRAQEFEPLNREFQAWKKTMAVGTKAARTVAPSDLDPRLLQQLRSLGYIH